VGEEVRRLPQGKGLWLLSRVLHSGATPELLARAALGKGQPRQVRAARSPLQHRSWGWRRIC